MNFHIVPLPSLIVPISGSFLMDDCQSQGFSVLRKSFQESSYSFFRGLGQYSQFTFHARVEAEQNSKVNRIMLADADNQTIRQSQTHAHTKSARFSGEYVSLRLGKGVQPGLSEPRDWETEM